LKRKFNGPWKSSSMPRTGLQAVSIAPIGGTGPRKRDLGGQKKGEVAERT